MITPFLIWFSGFIAAAILFYGNDEFLQEECGIKIKGNTLPRTIAASLGSWFVVLLIIDFMRKERGIFWKFPLGKHYAEVPVPRKLFWFPILTIMAVSYGWSVYGERFPLYVSLLFVGSIITAFCYLLTAKNWLYRLSTALGISGCLLPLIQMFINHNFHLQ